MNYEEPPISYSTTRPDNKITRLQSQLQSGTVQLNYDEKSGNGYLRSLLESLQIPVSSQVLTFGRTSLQDDRISPKTPRAIYFSDDLHLGYVQGGLIEIAVQDSELGMVFYTSKNEPGDVLFQRQTNSCLTCHGAARTRNVPGLLIRSVYPDPGGHPVVAAGSFVSTHKSPLEQRWGGWYVTGSHGDQQHLGNFVLTEAKKPKVISNPTGMNLQSVADRFDTSLYLSPHSDLVALMVLEHQTDTYNTLTQARFDVRFGKYLVEQAGSDSAALEAARKSLDQRIEKNTNTLVKALLFSEETKLTAPVSGTSDFVNDFAAAGVSDSKGRSLREFDLKTRMFRYPCSYLIQSEAFASLPEELQGSVESRLLSILRSEIPEKGFEHLSSEDRTAIEEILTETVFQN